MVGWPYYQEHQARVPTNGTEVLLVRELTNEYDTNAFAVHVRNGTEVQDNQDGSETQTDHKIRQIGHIPRKSAALGIFDGYKSPSD